MAKRRPITIAEVRQLADKIEEEVLEDENENAATFRKRGAWSMLPSARQGKRPTNLDKRNEQLRGRVRKELRDRDQFAWLTLDILPRSIDEVLVYPHHQMPGMGAPASSGKGLVVVLEASYLDGIFARYREVWTIKHMLGVFEKGAARIDGIAEKIGLESDLAQHYRNLRTALEEGAIQDDRVVELIQKSEKHYRKTKLEDKIEEAKSRLGVVNGN